MKTLKGYPNTNKKFCLEIIPEKYARNPINKMFARF
jgi:hypothetical protein